MIKVLNFTWFILLVQILFSPLCVSEVFALNQNKYRKSIKGKSFEGASPKTLVKAVVHNITVNKPTKDAAEVEFYNKNELKDIFDAYARARKKIESPVEIKSVNKAKGTEIAIKTQFINTQETNPSIDNLQFQIVFQAKFL